MRGKAARAAVYAFAIIGAGLSAAIAAGLVLDVRSVDRTRGGYEPPYTDFTGPPIDWSAADRTATGMAWRGRVVNLLVDCRTGMMDFEVYGLRIPWREFSPRALVVHQPRTACRELGFTPLF